MTVFVDTSAIIALLVQDDLMHNRAKRNFTYFAQNAVRLVSSSYVLIETVSLLQSRIGLNVVRDFNAKIFPLLDICKSAFKGNFTNAESE